MDDKKHEQEFIDPITTGPIWLFIFKQIIGAIISFFTFQALKAWWNKKTTIDQDDAF